VLAILGRQSREEGVLRIAKGLVGLGQSTPARGRDRDHVPASVLGVSIAFDQPPVFERVEQGDEDAVIDPHQGRQLALADRAAVGQEVEDAELARLELVLGERLADMAREALAEDREQETGPGTGAVEDLASLVWADGGHVGNVAPIVSGTR